MDQFKDMSIISWNIRGALGHITRRHVRDLVSLHHQSLVLLYEMHGSFNSVERLWTSLGYKLILFKRLMGTQEVFGFFLIRRT